MYQPRRLCFEDRTRRRTFAMYRVILATLLYTRVVSSAPQDSNVTFVQIQPFIDTETQNTTLESRVDNVSPTNVSFENNEFNNNDSHDVTTEVEEIATEIGDVPTTEEITTQKTTTTTTSTSTTTTTTTQKPKLSQSPRFLSKLSNFKNANTLNAVSTNSINTFAISPKVDKPYRRKFKSRCRCEKIENCPKLQITVPRCPNDYFLCCF